MNVIDDDVEWIDNIILRYLGFNVVDDFWNEFVPEYVWWRNITLVYKGQSVKYDCIIICKYYPT